MIKMTAYIKRRERYNHRSTPEVLWEVRLVEDNRLIRECKTRKEALLWQDIYTIKAE